MNSSGFEIQFNNMRSKVKTFHVVVVRGKMTAHFFIFGKENRKWIY